MAEIKRGDIYYVRLKKTGNHIQDGIRPCLVIQNDKGNECSPNTIVAPITTAIKNKLATHVSIPYGRAIRGTILCEAVVTISKESILKNRKSDHLSEETMSKVDEALKISVGL
ncbi:type II toxin-antitoxin system PemK/MazF family toxin [Pediococcus pentosaceus]|uniref:type II toxin-antitoxin system PemK/MazF family toxin n=1 Tax=Pediococcus pentosaceus TaxID=1255 RepID=UPI00232BF2A0|nr:type II toxin-antitoxin system PemK/MazF family toxin [Pediococcus pentosaceus]MDB1562951.1 type II toxin-antitoxin system PemK/MazF family toxin [Pediococcus pentosaceus]